MPPERSGNAARSLARPYFQHLLDFFVEVGSNYVCLSSAWHFYINLYYSCHLTACKAKNSPLQYIAVTYCNRRLTIKASITGSQLAPLASALLCRQLRDTECHLKNNCGKKTHLSKQTRPPNWTKGEILDGIFYQLKNGCNWEDLPKDLPPYSTV